MKAYKKIISFILTLVMMLSLSVNVFAAEPLTDDPNMIEWKYTVFADESLQKVVEEGVIPNAYARYTWRGITLKNGEVAILTPSNNSIYSPHICVVVLRSSAPVLLAGGYNLCYPVFRFYPLALKRAKLLRSATAMFVPVSFSLDSWSTLSSLHPA